MTREELILSHRVGERIADEVEKALHGRQTNCEEAAHDILAMIAPSPTPWKPDRGEDGWRPIETAPKDGTRVLLICASAYSPEARMGWWRSDGWVGLMPGGEKDPSGITRWFPTHWMPLPPPPALPTKEGGE